MQAMIYHTPAKMKEYKIETIGAESEICTRISTCLPPTHQTDSTLLIALKNNFFLDHVIPLNIKILICVLNFYVFFLFWNGLSASTLTDKIYDSLKTALEAEKSEQTDSSKLINKFCEVKHEFREKLNNINMRYTELKHETAELHRKYADSLSGIISRPLILTICSVQVFDLSKLL